MKDLLPRTEMQIIGALLLFVGVGGVLALAIWGVFTGISPFIAAGIALAVVFALYVIEAKRALRVER